jgi:hypothetical protein
MAHSTPLPWFRLYTRMIDDEKMRVLAFEDRWHFVALCCMKGSGLIDDDSAVRDRKIAVKLGVQLADLENIKKRLIEVGLIDESMSPLAWDELQFTSDTSYDRVKKYREKQKLSKVKRECNVSVTVQETDTDTDTDTELEYIVVSDNKTGNDADEGFDEFWKAYPVRLGDRGKKLASKAYKAATKRSSKQTILQGAIAYADFCNSEKRTGTPYVKLASSWLNQDGWSENYEVSNGNKSANNKHSKQEYVHPATIAANKLKAKLGIESSGGQTRHDSDDWIEGDYTLG